MSISLGANGNSFNYPQTDDTAWGDDATNWASAVSAALSAIGLGGTLTADAVINLQSTTKGFLPPRMTTVQRDAIATPSEGLLIYNTTTKLINVYNASQWVQFPISDALITNRLLQFDGTKIVSSVLSVTGSDFTVSGNIGANTASITGTATIGKVKTDDIEANTSAGLIINSANGTDVARFGASNTSDLEVGNVIRALSSAGILFEANGGTDVLTLGAGGGSGATFAGGVNITGTASVGSGTETNPDIHKDGDTNTGIWFNTADNISLVTGGATRFRVLSTGQLQNVYESTVGTDYNTTLHNGYLCRAWVNFNGTGTVAIRASGNVSSITDNGTGDYTINFATALPDANYNVVCSSKQVNGNAFNNNGTSSLPHTYAVGSVRILTGTISAGAAVDSENNNVSVFR